MLFQNLIPSQLFHGTRLQNAFFHRANHFYKKRIWIDILYNLHPLDFLKLQISTQMTTISLQSLLHCEDKKLWEQSLKVDRKDLKY